MDFANEYKESSHPTPAPRIPQMVVTSADDTTDELNNVTECTLVLIPPAPTPAREGEPDRPRENPEDISVIVRDVVSHCADSVSHSVKQRPLVIEVEKNVSPHPEEGVSPARCPTPPPPPAPSSSHPSAMQRPLVFEAATAKGDASASVDNEQPPYSQNEVHSVAATSIVPPVSEVPSEGKVSLDDPTSSSKKETSHGVKKFFGSLLHPETPETPVPEPEELACPKEPSSPSSEKSGIQKLFHLPKSESPKDKTEPCWSFEKSSEKPSDTKESTSFTKDAKQSIKAFFDTFKHPSKDQMESEGVDMKMGVDENVEQDKSLSPQPPKEQKDSAIKAFFDTFKHPTKDQPEKEDTEIKCDDVETQKSSSPEPPKEHKDSAIKSFFDTFKHPSKDQKEKESGELKSGIVEDAAKNKTPSPQPPIDDVGTQKSSSPQSPKEHKDSAMKSFFDTFKHPSKDQKGKEVGELKSATVEDTAQNKSPSPLPPIDDVGKHKSSSSQPPKEHKDSAMKSFFDTFKHPSKDQKEKEGGELKSRTIEDTAENKSPASLPPKKQEDSATKSFFDSLKQESSDKKPKSILCKKSASQPDFSKESEASRSSDGEDLKGSESFAKDAKHHKSIFDAFRHDSTDPKSRNCASQMSASQPDVCPESTKSSKEKETSSFAKDTKENIKSFFTFKHESSISKQKEESVQPPVTEESLPVSDQKEPVSKEPSASFAKDAKHNIKAFFDNLKHDVGDQKPKEDSHKKPTLSEPDLSQEVPDTSVAHHKEQKHSVKKLFSFKHGGHSDDIVISESAHNLDRPIDRESGKKSTKGTKSVKLDLTPTYSLNGVDNFEDFGYLNGYENEVISEPKERAQSVPSEILQKSKSYDFSFHESEKVEDNLESTSGTSHQQQKEGFHGIKKFFGSFKHEKLKATKSAPDLGPENEKDNTKIKTSIHDSDDSKAIEKPLKEKKNKSIRRSLSDKVSREEMVQNFKGFFDSIGHRSPTKKSPKEMEHIYDTVEVRSEPVPAIQVISAPTEESEKSTSPKCEKQGIKKIFSSKAASSKSVSNTASASPSPVNKDIVATDAGRSKGILRHPVDVSQTHTEQAMSSQAVEAQVSEIDSSMSPKPDKSSMLNSIGENILALKDKMMHGKEKRKSYLDESTKSPQPVEPSVEDGALVAPAISSQPKPSGKVKPAVPEKPALSKMQPKAPTPTQTTKAKPPEENLDTSPTSPTTLYDTCCMKIAVLLRDKALHIVSDQTKSPPPKPPKPSAEAIARARAAAVSRRLAGAKSAGNNILPGCENLRFADDDTESSCDYKDLENFNYIIDYELIHRYKLENKLDTFSASSGLTSYYTADISSLRDEIYSDAVMETVSLNSDISCNVKQLASSSNKTETKKSLASTSNASKDSKVSSVKKVPPPVPPKPVMLQNISKIKAKPGESAVSPCVNGLSLSPRLQRKFPKDPTQKRPLMVADVKGTQVSSLPHSKSKTTPKKPLRSFEIVLKNESLKNVSPVDSAEAVTASPIGASSPQPQTSSTVTLSQSSFTKAEKRTVSPPRPPPPNIAKKPIPQRPPPPDEGSLKRHKEQVKKQKMECDNHSENLVSGSPEPVAIPVLDSSSKISPETKDLDEKSLASPDTEKDKLTPSDEKIIPVDGMPQEKMAVSTIELDLNSNQIEVNNSMDADKAIADSLNNNTDKSEEILLLTPKPPPRGRRIRSRTVEIVKKSPEESEERLKRSQSLSDIDVEKRVTFLEAEKSKMDAKSLYSSVNKDGKRMNSQTNAQSSPDLVSGRPLPPPPPPPRKFRSLERKSKSVEGTHRVESPSPVKPPSRRRRTEKERFFSLHSETGRQTDSPDEVVHRAASMPTKPDRKMKSSRREEYDVNANISSFRDNSSSPNIPVDHVDSIGRSKSSPKGTDKRKQSHSSWYDEGEFLEESWEKVDAPDLDEELKFSPKVPLRKKSDSKRKMRETSKFYVNMEADQTPLCLVDKETSPLPLDCSEKSVQTSLETLSQGIVSSRDMSREVSHDVSHDDQSEDTDELLDLAQTLQKELSTIINRHKLVNDSSEETPSPPLSAAASEKNVAEDSKGAKKISSLRSSTSEVWPLTSSDESDAEAIAEESLNLNEVAAKKKQKKIFYIAREIMTSEEIFVDALKLLNVDFKAAVQSAGAVLPEECLSQILNHLPQLQHLNENLLSELRDRIQCWEKIGKIADIIVKMGPFLKLYSWYIHDFEANVALLEDCKKKYPAFAQVVKEFEASPRCKRLALHHYMLKPIQRIPQYRLLLQEYLQHLGGEEHLDYHDTVAALQIVSEVANHANESMKQGDNAQKLISLQNSIMGHKEIVKPGRVFVKEGELMKLSRKGMQPRWFVLFNDLLLYLTNVQQGLYRMNHELPLTGMKVAIPIQQDYQNEFSIISVTRSFTLAAKSPEERQEWIVALTKAIEENASKRSTFTNTRLMQQKAHDRTTSSEDESGSGGFVLGRKAPVWIPDARVTMCQLCTSEFTVTFRRHHCRACGKVVCSICSSHRISLPYLGNRIARVCDECHMRLGQGSSACTESGETDSENQQIALKSHLRTDNTRHPKKYKRSLPSVLKEVCANDQGSTISGYLHILRDKGRGWKRDWFVLKDKVFYQYRASEDVAALKSMPLLGYQIELFSESYEGVEAALLFQLTHPGQPPIVFYADTPGATERWVSALETATVLE